MTELYQKILYATIKNWELEERLRRDDFTLDGFAHLAEKIGHKNPSTLRKMCEERIENGAKLGYKEAIIVMSITHDYRLLKFMEEELKTAAKADRQQLDFFSQPLRSLDNSTDEFERKKL